MSLRKSFTVSLPVVLFLLGGGAALDAACSPSSQSAVTDGGLVCNPDSGDPAGCACDPGKDKPADCYTGPAGTSGKGACKTGTRTCLPNGTFSACEGEVTPQPETCNYADDDCNGIVDDLPEITDAAAIARCNSPACDNANLADAAITCWGPDPGICGAGVLTCAGGPTGGQPTGCEEFIHTPAPEVCNGLDDDCNGKVDDGLDNEGPCDMPNGSTWAPDANPFDGGTPTHVLGECVHGNLTCVATNCNDHGCKDAGDKCMPSQPQLETQQYGYGCDGLDNDCNGIIDDHACADSWDKTNGYDYCCTDGVFYNCEQAQYIDSGWYTSCKLAN
jgi:hypothetical protein